MNLNSDKIRKLLPDTSVYTFETVTSTNTVAREKASIDINSQILVAAEEQTAGKGRQGKSFYSPKGTGVYFSVVIKPEYDATQAVTLTSAAAVAVVRALEKLTNLHPKIKWVNDIYINDKKVCGILVQAYSENSKPFFVIGVGINISTEDFPADITNAGSLNIEIDKNELIAEISKNLFEITKDLLNKKYMQEYREHSCVTGKNITYYINNEAKKGHAVDVDDNGGLIIETESKKITTLTSGEITVRMD